MGLAVAGTGFGGIALPPLWTYLLEEYFFRGTLLIIGAFMLHLCFVGTLYRPIQDNYPLHQETNGHNLEKQRMDLEKKSLLSRLGFDCGLMKHMKFILYI